MSLSGLEWVMSSLNLSLQNVSLARNRMEEAESIVKGKTLLGRE